MLFRRPAAIVAITGALVLGIATSAFADGGGGDLPARGDACAGPILVSPGHNAEETGTAVQTGTNNPVSVKWSIWENSVPDLSTATRAIAFQGSPLYLQAVLNTGSASAYYWGCLFNNSSPSVEVTYTVTINQD